MILTKKEILNRADKGEVILDGVSEGQIKDNSVDVSLHKYVWVGKESYNKAQYSYEVLKQFGNNTFARTHVENTIQPSIDAFYEIKNNIIQTNKYWHLVSLEKPLKFIPGLFVLACVDEWVGTRSNTDLCCEFRLKSTPARLGLDHSFASWIETGYFSRLCLELSFHQTVKLQAGSLIGQYIFHQTTDKSVDYTEKGSYQSNTNLDEIKKNWTMDSILPASNIKIKV